MANSKIILGAVAYLPKVVTIWEGMRDFFASHNVPFDFVLFSNYEEQVDFLLEGKIDIAWNAPLAHVRVRHRTNMTSLSLGMRDTDRDFHSRLIVRHDSGIKSIQDLKNKRIGVGSKDSTQARILPLYFLEEAGLDLSAVSLQTFDSDLGKHGDTGKSELEVLQALQTGKVDAGVLGDWVWMAELAAGHIRTEVLDSLWTTPAYDHCMFDALTSIDTKKAKQFTDALFSMKWENAQHRKLLELEGLKEWQGPREQGYETLWKAVERLGISL